MLEVPPAQARQDADVLGVLEGLDRLLLGSVAGISSRVSSFLAPSIAHLALVSWSADRARASSTRTASRSSADCP